MTAKNLSRNMNRIRKWGEKSTRRWAKSNYRMRWGSFDDVGVRMMIDRVDGLNDV